MFIRGSELNEELNAIHDLAYTRFTSEEPNIYTSLFIPVFNSYISFFKKIRVPTSNPLWTSLTSAISLTRYKAAVKELDKLLNTQYEDFTFDGFGYLTEKENADKEKEVIASPGQTETEILNTELNRIHNAVYVRYTSKNFGNRHDARITATFGYRSFFENRNIIIDHSILVSLEIASTPLDFRSAVGKLDKALNSAYEVSSFHGAALINDKIIKEKMSTLESDAAYIYRKTKTKLFDKSQNIDANLDGKNKDTISFKLSRDFQ